MQCIEYQTRADAAKKLNNHKYFIHDFEKTYRHLIGDDLSYDCLIKLTKE